MRSGFAAILLISSVVASGQEPGAAEAETGGPQSVVQEIQLSPRLAEGPPEEQGLPEEKVFADMMRDAGTSPLDYSRALESFLELYPETQKRAQIERSIAQTALEQGDRRRLLLYGEQVIQREPHNLMLVEHVTRALLASDDPEKAGRALKYALQLENAIRLVSLQQPSDGSQAVAIKEKTDGSLGKALVYQARALGNLGRYTDAAKAATASYAANPTAEAARETGRWLVRMGRKEEAILRYAEAFIISDPDNTARLRQGDREQLGKLFVATRGSEEGLGEIILDAYDRVTRQAAERYRAFQRLDPNYGVTDPMEFVLAGVEGQELEMDSLKGKVVVLDFWATWCKPCRVQQPLYEEVKAKFADRDDVVFLNISTDQNREAVLPFLEREEWEKTTWFEDGLQELFQVSNIPTTILIDRNGDLAGRMNGFHPERFVDMLTVRIERLLE